MRTFDEAAEILKNRTLCMENLDNITQDGWCNKRVIDSVNTIFIDVTREITEILKDDALPEDYKADAAADEYRRAFMVMFAMGVVVGMRMERND